MSSTKTRIILPCLILLFCFGLLRAQTGAFQLIVTHNAASRTLEYYVPMNYNPANDYPLVVGLHGCVGGANPAAGYRDDLQFLSDSIGAIVVCPLGNIQQGMMDNPDHTMILTAIDTTIGRFSIDTTSVYLTGFSCNGYVTAKYGTRELYDWKGIIPFNAAFISQDFTNGSFDFSTNKPICVCIGTSDPSMGLNNRFRDSLVANGNTHLYNTMPGIGHTTNFATFDEEMMECFHWFESLGPVGTDALAGSGLKVQLSPNPAQEMLRLSIETDQPFLEGKFILHNALGQEVFSYSGLQASQSIDLSGLQSGIYFWQIELDEKRSGSGKLLLD